MAGTVIEGTGDRDILNGTGEDEFFYGYGGNDTIRGKGGNDIIDVGTGNDTAFGGTGDDTFELFIGDGDLKWKNRLDGGAGIDTLAVEVKASGAPGRQIYVFDAVKGTAGFIDAKVRDTIVSIENFTAVATMPVWAYGNAADNRFWGGFFNDVLRGGGGDDSLTGFGGDDKLFGDAGNDLLVAFFGNDKLFGGAGNDRLYMSSTGSHLFDGGTGRDTFSADRDALAMGGTKPFVVNLTTGMAGFEGADASTLATLRGIENLVVQSKSGPVILVGNSGNNRLTSEGGADRLEGRGGNDVLWSFGGTDMLIGGAGNDKLFGGGDKDTMLGGTGADVLIGDHGMDQITGGRGQDRMDGGLDAMEDTFHFLSAADSSRTFALADRIENFETLYDVIELSAIDADLSLAGDQDFFFRRDAGPGANSVWLEEKAEGTWLMFDNTGDGVRDFALLIADVTGVTDANLVGVFW